MGKKNWPFYAVFCPKMQGYPQQTSKKGEKIGFFVKTPSTKTAKSIVAYTYTQFDSGSDLFRS